MNLSRRSIRRVPVLVPALFLSAIASAAWGIVPPRGGGRMPEPFLEARRLDRRAFTVSRVWRGEAPGAARGQGPMRLPSSKEGTYSLSGTLRIPVIAGLYSDYPTAPVETGQLQAGLFDGPRDPGTMTDYWAEVSSGLLEVSGEVYGWVDLARTEAYYTGLTGGLVPGTSHTDEMIASMVASVDPEVDFGIYDNDGPDGVPDSGDDDGFVDVLVIVHPSFGAECNYALDHMWSHSWQYSLWQGEGGSPLPTDDRGASGGFIMIDEYIVAPSLSCEEGAIEIGVFCHELGHLLGMQDLYDYNGGGAGVGYWGLMGTGNWNTPSSPAHPCAFSKELLGWASVIDVDWRATDLSLAPVVESAEVARMVLPTRRFRRVEPLAHPYGHALVCGYDAAEAGARNWPGGAGYGNEWNESISKEFEFDGNGPVTLEFDMEVDLEAGYDHARLLLEADGAAAETLGSWTHRVTLAAQSVDVGAALPTGATSYTLRFVLTSDFNYSDEDGFHDSDPGRALLIDNIRLSGGGEDYFTDLETDAGGWRETSPPAEYFLAEHRTRSGFDSQLPGEGLLIWHVEKSIAMGDLGNSGGYSNTQARGVVLEEADGDFDLLADPYYGGNNGDAGDPWPGTSGRREFAGHTTPSSRDNSGRMTPVSITGISGGGGLFEAGMPAPEVLSVFPDTMDKQAGGDAVLDIFGGNIPYGASCYLTRDGRRVEGRVDWFGEGHITASFDMAGLIAGGWMLTVEGDDGRRAEYASEVTVLSRVLAADVEVGRSFIRPVWAVTTTSGLRGCVLLRSEAAGPFEPLGADTLRSGTGLFSLQDDTVVPGVEYSYMVRIFYDGVEEEYLFPGSYSIEEFPFHIVGAYPNPFRESVTVSFFVASGRTVRVDFYDVAGRRMPGAVEGSYGRGTHEVEWAPPGDVASGVYFCAVRVGPSMRTVKLVLIR